MRNALQEQLLKAGLAKKGKVDQVAREQVKQRQGKAPTTVDPGVAEAEKARQERVERDRAIAAERKAQAEGRERLAQARQIIEQHRVVARGEDLYRFADGPAIRSVPADAGTRAQLAKGAFVVVRDGLDGYAVIPKAAGDKVAMRDPALIVVDHSQPSPATPAGSSGDSADEAYYSRFQVPDDLIW